jgi:hypothetical protein
VLASFFVNTTLPINDILSSLSEHSLHYYLMKNYISCQIYIKIKNV